MFCSSPSAGGDELVVSNVGDLQVGRERRSVGQHQEGEGKHEAQQDKQEGAYAPDGCQYTQYFVFSSLWFHKCSITAALHRINKIRRP